MDDVDELEDVNRRPRDQEQDTQTNRHLEESVQLPVLGPAQRAQQHLHQSQVSIAVT